MHARIKHVTAVFVFEKRNTTSRALLRWDIQEKSI